ncbi:MAG TPA: DUF6427 family protein [Flavobacteriaceae bacterium]|nr:DUF6427 family protein [Flavobacteriaceae bacterium]
MLTSFFKKSNPINYLVPLLVISLFFIVYNFSSAFETFTWSFLIKKIAALAVLLTSAFILNFILIKDKSKGRNTYPLFLFSFFIISHWVITINSTVIFAGFFIVLALHRIIGMKTGQLMTKKIFDSCFFIGLAGLIFPPALFFIIIPFWGVLYFAPENYKNWLIPFPAMLSVFILKTAIDLYLEDNFFNPFDLFTFQQINYEEFLNYQFLVPVLLILLFTLWASINILTAKIKVNQVQKKADFLLIISFFVSLAAITFSGAYTTHNGAALLFPYITCALIGGRYFEIPQRKSSKIIEILLLTLSIVCFSFAILSIWN